MSAMTETEIQLAQKFRAGGMSWADLGRCFNVNSYAVRYNIDPDFRSRRIEHMAEQRQKRRELPPPPPEEDARPTKAETLKALLSIPLDTRDLTGRIFGDPLPGRSALDQRASQ